MALLSGIIESAALAHVDCRPLFDLGADLSEDVRDFRVDEGAQQREKIGMLPIDGKIRPFC